MDNATEYFAALMWDTYYLWTFELLALVQAHAIPSKSAYRIAHFVIGIGRMVLLLFLSLSFAGSLHLLKG